MQTAKARTPTRQTSGQTTDTNTSQLQGNKTQGLRNFKARPSWLPTQFYLNISYSQHIS